MWESRMQRLANKGETKLYEDEYGYWCETELDLDSTQLSFDGARGLERGKLIRQLQTSPAGCSDGIEDEEARDELHNLVRPVLVKLWKAGKIATFGEK